MFVNLYRYNEGMYPYPVSHPYDGYSMVGGCTRRIQFTRSA
jgi:hypothetical protein